MTQSTLNTIQLHCVGLSHHTTPIMLRERFSFSSEEMQNALTNWRNGDHVRELVILSTCNRLELYATAENYHILRDFLAESRGVCAKTLGEHLYHHVGQAAVHHLFQVATGLDSMVLGEPQILGQVTQAFETAVVQKSIGRRLTRLFRAAIRTGKRAHTETKISQNSMSVSSAAVRMLANHLGTLTDKRILIVGAGQMAKLALKSLVNYRPQHITISNRSLKRAQQLAKAFEADVLPFLKLQQSLNDVDLVVAATGSTKPIFSLEMVSKAMSQRHERPLCLVDLAVPRDVDPKVGKLPFVHLFDVDDLQQQVDTAREQRQNEVPQVEMIIQSELEGFMQQEREAAVQPLITDLRRHAEEIRQQELRRTLRHLPSDLDAETRKHVEHLSQSLVKKLLHTPTVKLRQEAGSGQAEPHVESLRFLFELENLA